MSWKDEVAANFSGASNDYDAVARVQKKSAQRLVALLPDVAQDILEIGCGTGALTQALVYKYPQGHVRATDISPQMLAQARRVVDAPNVAWDVMDGERPIDDGQRYDLIVANMVFQWFEDIEAAVACLQKLLKAGGKIIYAKPAEGSFKEWRETLEALSLPVGLLDFKTVGVQIARESYVEQYPNAMSFLRAMHRMGAHHPRAGYQPLSVAEMRRACALLDERYGARASWDVVYAEVGG